MCWKFGYRMHHKRNQRGSNMILIGVRNHVHGPMIKHTWCVYDERVHIDFKIARAGLVSCFRSQKLSVTRGAFGTCRCLALCTFLSQKSRPIKKFRIPYWLLCSVMYKIMPCIIGRISQYGSIVNIFLFFLGGILRLPTRAAGHTILRSKLQLTENIIAFWNMRLWNLPSNRRVWCGPSQSIKSLVIRIQLLSDQLGLPTAAEGIFVHYTYQCVPTGTKIQSSNLRHHLQSVTSQCLYQWHPFVIHEE